MSHFTRAGQAGQYRTRISDFQCPRVNPCGYRCEAGVGGHDGPHLFEEHPHRHEDEVLAEKRAIYRRLRSYPPSGPTNDEVLELLEDPDWVDR